MRPDADDGEKRTNEIGTAIPLLETLPDIAGRTVTADVLLTQRALASYLLDRGADFCCFARYLTTDFPDCFTRPVPGFPGLFGLCRSAAPVLTVSEVGAVALSD